MSAIDVDVVVDNSSTEDWFEIWRGTGKGDSLLLIGTSTNSDYSDLAVSASTTYTYKVRAHIEGHVDSLWTTATVRTPGRQR